VTSIDWLQERMQGFADRCALVWRDEDVRYGELLAAVAAWERRLDAEGVGRGLVVALEGDYSPDAVALLLALIARNTVTVPLASVSPAERDEFLDTAEVQVVVTLDQGEAPRVTRRGTAVRHALTRRLPLALVSMSNEKLSLRWADLPRRAEWPEDIDLFGNAEGILVSIHVGTAEQRRLLVGVLAEELAKMNAMPVTFEEP